MFKKKPTIKNLSPLRSSDRRKIADQIISDYEISVPTNPTTPLDSQSATSSLNLTAIRNSLLPENVLTARFTTTTGPDLQKVQGIVYVGVHPGDDERVLWFKVEQGPGSSKRLYPTVYTLWRYENLLPLLYTPEMVMQKLRGGADLMTPGLANEPPFPKKAKLGAVVAVASLDNHSVPLFVGICEIDVSALERVQGTKGHAVRGIHWEGDELWAWSSSSRPGRPAPEYLQGWDEEAEEVTEAVGGLTLQDKEGDVAASDDIDDASIATEDPVTEEEPTTKEIDDAFVNAFVYALYQLKQDNPTSTNHNLTLPVSASMLISNLITPYLPIYSSQQAQFYSVKKTSWKNVKKFIKQLDKLKLVKSKDRNGQETVILDVDFDDQRVQRFVPYRLPSTDSSSRSEGKKTAVTDDADSSVGQSLTIQTLYRPTGKLMPDIFPALSSGSTQNHYTHADVSSHLDKYLQAQDPPLVSRENRRIITLNPFLANTIFTSASSDDQSALRRGMVTRDGLLKRMEEDHSLLQPYYAFLKAGQTLADVKPKSGTPPKVSVILEKRTGSKTVTRVSNLEVFGVIPAILAEELQKKCASSTSVTQAVGAPKGVMEILVQGDHRKILDSALTRRGLKSQWISVVDKTKKKK